MTYKVTGKKIATASALNPQAPYGADVITRIQAALSGKLRELTDSIRSEITRLVEEVCVKTQIQPGEIGVVSIVGNPAMQQLFLGLMPDNLAAGPALEGAKIRFGMQGADGAIDHVWTEGGKLRCSVIGGGEARGVCGSGLIDAIAVLLEARLINKRGRIQATEAIDGQRVIRLTDTVYLTQDDIHEVQLAKGAIAAGIEMMAEQIGITVENIDKVLLAGAFGSFMKAENACRIGLLLPVLDGKITAIGNAAGSGAKMIACSREEFQRTQTLKDEIEFIELASLPRFQRVFAKNMNYPEG